MAKLADLKKLVDAARDSAAAPKKSGPAKQPSAAPSAPGAFDLAQAFADVKRLPASKRVSNQAPRPAPIARQRIADDADALTASKYGAEPAPTAWDLGQEQEAEQTFQARSLPEPEHLDINVEPARPVNELEIRDPDPLAAQFDDIASEWAPKFTSLKYRWAALKLRKSSKDVRSEAKLLADGI